MLTPLTGGGGKGDQKIKVFFLFIMNSLFLINESFTNGYISNILDIISILAIFCGISVIVNKNPIISVLFLIGLFASVSSYLILLGLSFIGLAYLIVYIGAISILFLFILMLINIRISELQSNTNNSIPLTIILGISLSYSLFQLLPYDIAILSNFSSNINNNLYNLSMNKQNNGNFGINTTPAVSLQPKNNDLLFVTSKI
jgi:NADH-ubiquinone oxidoreductase chain 6